ncbi:hypothetical protein Rsub_11712 [Raphidocelis subcapitata]|uniref:DUF7906 domain-containing protein n=1 Tax=Raphidocelis subcapitata TaxID=307507 RepID=A0A2V0PM25_9CHLO|nr:hypothetical protein Rsub_11712 [Raphidocelis subcapitata]|eukprot:GBF98920.1 hypothetical protein Rsub_11712 [Raphidocelis subcapitata]
MARARGRLGSPAAPRQCSSSSGSAHRSQRAQRAVGPLLLLSLLAAAPIAAGYDVHVGHRAAVQLAQFVSRRPFMADALSEMPDPIRTAWALDLKLSAGQTLTALEVPRVAVTLTVKLVGFDGTGAGGVVIEPHELSAQLAALAGEFDTIALEPSPHHMAVRPKVDFLVVPSHHSLGDKVAAALTAAVKAATPSTDFAAFPLAAVDPAAVASALEGDYLGGRASAGPEPLVLYILNPRVEGVGAYAYAAESGSCPSAVYVSRSHRYAFYDMSANVTFMGPGPGGRGQVLPHSLPVLSHYRPEAARRALPPDLAALAAGAARHLAWPPLSHGDVGYSPEVDVRIIYMHQDILSATSTVDRERLQSELQGALGPLQTVSVHEHWLPFGNCPHCVAGYSGALRTRTPHPHEEGDTVRYLDLESLSSWVAEWREVVLSDIGAGDGPRRSGGGSVLPVFVFDAAGRDPVLLDGWRQAVALPGGPLGPAVVAVVSGGGTAVPTFFGCHHQRVTLDARKLQRPVTAAVLSAGWGVADTAQFWSEATGRGWWWLWSVGDTPFGPLSASPALSFVQRDAARRNLVVASLNATVGHAAALVAGFAAVGGPEATVRSFLPPDQVIPYNQRLSLLLFKVESAASALARRDYTTAMGYAASAAFDAAALHTITRRARNMLSVELECAGGDARARWWLVPGAAAAACALMVVVRVWRAVRGGGARDRNKSHVF